MGGWRGKGTRQRVEEGLGREGKEERERDGGEERERVGEARRSRDGEVLETYLWSHQVLVAFYPLYHYRPVSVGHKQIFKVQLTKLLISV